MRFASVRLRGSRRRGRFRPGCGFSVETPVETLATLRAYEAAGTQCVIVKILDAADLDPVRPFAREVMPAFDGK